MPDSCPNGRCDVTIPRESEEEEHVELAVPGPESHESEETLSPDELGTEDEPVRTATSE